MTATMAIAATTCGTSAAAPVAWSWCPPRRPAANTPTSTSRPAAPTARDQPPFRPALPQHVHRRRTPGATVPAAAATVTRTPGRSARSTARRGAQIPVRVRRHQPHRSGQRPQRRGLGVHLVGDVERPPLARRGRRAVVAAGLEDPEQRQQARVVLGIGRVGGRAGIQAEVHVVRRRRRRGGRMPSNRRTQRVRPGNASTPVSASLPSPPLSTISWSAARAGVAPSAIGSGPAAASSPNGSTPDPCGAGGAFAGSGGAAVVS